MPHTPTACTIIATNYLAHARTLCKSFLEHHPGGQFNVLFIDDPERFIDPAGERFRVFTLDDLPLPNAPVMSFRYDVTELATAVKPFFLRQLLDRGEVDRLLYLDPDILVTAPLDSVYRELDGCEVLLTPHLDRDYPDDGKSPDDAHILRSGVYNLGFIGIRRGQESKRFLHWWEDKLATKCVIDHGRGYFVDQRFVDLARALFRNFEVARDPALNVAYWNLHSRAVTFENGEWRVNGEPMKFFHFSGYDLRVPGRISSHQNRFDLADQPALGQLFERYREELAANGFQRCFPWPYGHGRYTCGKRVLAEDRKVFAANFADRFDGNPFDRRSHARVFWWKVRSMRFKAWLQRMLQAL